MNPPDAPVPLDSIGVRTQLQSSLGAAYTLGRELGGGGMSKVFLAEDVRLGRTVVVKVLSGETAAELSVARFEREIRLAATLQHPNIVPVLAAGEMGGLPYYTMPFVEGLALRDTLSRRGPLPIKEAVAILRDVARALSYAHDHGVVHRDIKPENILLSGDAAVVTDFGIAKAIAASQGRAQQTALTEAGTAIGTPAYMAPEQAIADPSADHRVDLYALGCVAYELLTGTPPFAGDSTHQLIAAHLTEQPVPVASRRGDVPKPLADLVMRCLAKEPDARPPSAAEVGRQLDQAIAAAVTAPTAKLVSATIGTRRGIDAQSSGRRQVRPTWWVAAAVAGTAIVIAAVMLSYRRGHGVVASNAARSLAVLEFENRSRDTASDYLVEGLSDELRTRLTGVSGLTVKGRASSAALAGRADLGDIAGKLGVTTILTGVVSRLGSSLHVNAELDDTHSGNTLWVGNYDFDVRALPMMRDSLAKQVISALGVGTEVSRSPDSDRGTSSVEAYDQFLRGEHAVSRLDFSRAAGYYAAAVRRDSSFARGWASLTIALASLPRDGLTPTDSALAAARLSLAHAVRLDSAAPLVRVAQATVLGMNFDFEQAARILGDVVARDSADVFANEQYAWMLGNLGRVNEALAVVERVRRMDPLNPFATLGRQYTLELLGRYAESVEAGREGLEDAAGDAIMLRNMGAAYAFSGQPDSAVATMERARRADSLGFSWRNDLAIAYATAGRWADVDRLDASMRSARPTNSPAYSAAVFDIINARYDQALTQIERGVATKQPMFSTAWLSCDPTFAPLHGNPRFAAIVASLGARLCDLPGAWPIRERPEKQ